MSNSMPGLSTGGCVVVFRDERDEATLFAYSPHGERYLTLTYRATRPTWRWMLFFEIVDTVPVRHVVVSAIPLPIKDVASVGHEWHRRLHALFHDDAG